MLGAIRRREQEKVIRNGKKTEIGEREGGTEMQLQRRGLNEVLQSSERVTSGGCDGWRTRMWEGRWPETRQAQGW